MTDIIPPDEHASDSHPSLDSLLRDALPEIRLALGDLIDRENSRSLPGKYAKLLPESLLVITLNPEAAESLAPLADALERDLSDSVTRHGSLYDRSYRVQLRRSEDPDAPLYRVSAHAGHQAEPAAPDNSGGDSDRTEFAPAPLPVADPDATRLDQTGPAGWQPGRWVLVVRNLEGEEIEAFRLTDPLITVGRRSEDPELHTTVGLKDLPHVSRRHLALLWEERNGAPGFLVYNLGLNAVHVRDDREIPGAHLPRGPLALEAVPETNTVWLRPGDPLRIGDHGPVLQIEEVPEEADEDEVDPDATRAE